MRSVRVMAMMAAFVALAMPSAGRATGTLDQQQTEADFPRGLDVHSRHAQMFTAGITGSLDQVDLFLGAERYRPDPLELVISVEAVSDGVPSGVQLTGARVPIESVPPLGGWVAIPIPPVPVSAGEQYAIVAAGGQFDVAFFRWFTSIGDAYPGGAPFIFSEGLGTWDRLFSFDYAFKTFVASADTTPPVIECSASPETLWPPNHKLKAIDIDLSATDDSGSVAAALVSVTSSQADTGLDPEDVPNDIQSWESGVDDRSGLLRAERFEEARTYTFTYEAEDPTGNTATCATAVTVPKSQKKKD